MRLSGCVLVVLTLGCSGGEEAATPPPRGSEGPPAEAPAPPEAPEAPEAEPTATAPPPEDGAAAPEPPPPAGAFELQPEEEVQGVADRFVLWGWSADGARYAFSTYDPGPGGRDCEGTAELFVVDAGRDAYVKGARASFDFGPEVHAPCPEPHPFVAHDEALAPKLAEQGIVKGQVGTRLALTPSGEGRWSVALPGGRGSLAFAVTGEARRAEGPEGNGYRAVLSRGKEELVIEAGTRKRDWIWDYSPQALFLSPDGQHALLVVQREGMGFEGSHITFMTNGFVLPEAMR